VTVIEVGEQEFEEQVLRGSHDVPVVVDFWAGWCRPCLVLGPLLERLAGEHEGRFVLAKVDVDRSPALAARYGVQGIPAVKAFVGGEVVDEFVGAYPEEGVRLFLRGILPSEAEDIVAEAAAAEAGDDLEAAEKAYRRALEADPGHEDATVGLARVLTEQGQDDEAASLLEGLPSHPEARRLAAELELRSAGVATGEHREALERALAQISSGAEGRDEARALMVTIFDALGEEHPLTREYRPRLASALF
jgi:putative thioredoxin